MPFIRYTIEMNGAFVYDTWEKKGLYRAEVGKETSTRMFSYMKTLPVAISCYQNRQAWMEKEAWENLEEYAPCQEQYPTMKRVHAPLENVTEAIFQQGDTLQKLQVFVKRAEAEQRDGQLKKMQEKFPELAVSCSLINNIEVNAPEANKGSALMVLCEQLGIDRMESMAFGDGTNDITMIREAGIGVAMANAASEVLAVADRVTASNDEDGVALVIEELLKNWED